MLPITNRILASSLLWLAAVLPMLGQAPPADRDDGYAAMERLTQGLELIRQNYVDEGKVGYDRLIASALRGMLEDLDPHCQYLSPEVLAQLKETPEEATEGLGLTVSPKAGRMMIVAVREDGPAARAGVVAGDGLVRIGQTLVDSLSYVEVVRQLRGEPGESVKLTVASPAKQAPLEIELVREKLRQVSVREAMILPESMTGALKLGYVRLREFNAPSAKELSDALDALEEKGLQGLVFDLRNNPGGLLSSAVDICGEFLPPNTTVVTTETRLADQNPPPFQTKDRHRPARTYPLVVLVNHNSASASELTAGALQDLKRALLVGETTFGKGSVQTIIPAEHGTAIRLTTAKYFTPSHRVIHEIGIPPDIISTLTPQQESSLATWRRNHPTASGDPQQISQLGDTQLERAIAALKALLVK